MDDPGTSLEQQKIELQRSLEISRSANEAGKDALNASLLINGGAVVAVLSFLGATVGKGAANSLGLALTKPLLAFGAGVLLSAVAFGARYLTGFSQNLNVERRPLAIKLNVLTVALAIFAYVAFSTGVYQAYLAFDAFFSHAP